jgi:acyl-[acyl carrier protein]--UDP-N-acetylglucosamine O-acyltransferase
MAGIGNMAGFAGIGNMAGFAGIGNMAGFAGIGNMAGFAGIGNMAGFAGIKSMRQSLPVHALIAGNDCRSYRVKRGASRWNAGFRAWFSWHGDCIRIRAASLAVV